MKIGEIVEINNSGIWERAMIIKYAPYYHRSFPGGKMDGYEYQFNPVRQTDPVTGITPSQGGWAPINKIRKI